MSRSVRPDRPSAPSAKAPAGFTIQVQRCCVDGCDKPGTHRVEAAGASTWYCDDHYQEDAGGRPPAPGQW